MTRALTVGLSALLNMPPEGLIKRLSFGAGLLKNQDEGWPHDLSRPVQPLSLSLFDKDSFLSFLRQWNFTKTISISEASNIYDILHVKQKESGLHKAGIFSLILLFAKRHISLNGHELLCRHDDFVLWRETIHCVGQTPFICAFHADNDQKAGRGRTDFNFSPYLKTDDFHLRQILARGVAENHYHLYGSSPAFLMNWVCLMNHTLDRGSEFKRLKETLSTSGGYFDRVSPSERLWSLHNLTRLAAGLRIHIWDILNSRHQEPLPYAEAKPDPISDMLRLNWDGLQSAINGYRFLMPGSLDYTLNTENSTSAYAPISGENYFLYRVFRAIFNCDPRISGKLDYFYTYLLIYCRIRSELIQNNDAVGFANFQKYQDRKGTFISASRYRRYNKAFARIALESSLATTGMKSLEARICPNSDPGLQAKEVESVLRSLKPSVGPQCLKDHCEYYDPLLNKCLNEFGRCKNKLNMISLAMHIPKRLDDPSGPTAGKDPLKSSLKCRHEIYRRRQVRRPIRSIMYLRQLRHHCAKYIYALDACSNEIGCRPEVFAPAFRRARHEDIGSAVDELLNRTYIPPLHITYHVGEDFLDIVDGLRAIDEAIRFLGLKNSDRLGHALALGISATDFYVSKANRIFLPRHDLLDNTAWFYMTLQRFNIDSPELLFQLREVFRAQYNAVYVSRPEPYEGEPSLFGGAGPSIETYYDAWKLRGDEPHYYKDSSALDSIDEKAEMAGEHLWALQQAEDILDIRRHDRTAARLYHRYHYHHGVKSKGGENIEFQIPACYTAAVSRLQLAMQKYVASLGIGIECNLSSNYLIGTFKNYANHPLLVFNHDGLCGCGEEAQLMASINTDDQGVFDTDLESEYALLACALKNERDEQGRPLYQPARIYKYINRIRKLGLSQSFRKLDQSLLGERKNV